MVDLTQVAQQQPAGPPLVGPLALGARPIQTPQGGAVVLEIMTMHGPLAFGLSPKSAIEFGRQCLQAGRAAATGLTLIGDVGSGDE